MSVATKPMRILVTNDDGIHARGPRRLRRDRAARCPTTSGWWRRSSTSPASRIRSRSTIRCGCAQVGERRFAVKGTPTDCVIMGARHILKDRPPDLVLSGVNRGRNAAEDVIYSGTVAGAIEGTILGIPSFALSQAYKSRSEQPPHWDTAVKYGPDIIRRALAAGIPRDVLINVNFPDCAPGEVKGIAVSAQGRNATRSGCRSTRARTAAAIRITGSPMCARGHAAGRRHRPFRARRQPHRGDAAAARHDRRAVHDQARRAVR